MIQVDSVSKLETENNDHIVSPFKVPKLFVFTLI